MALQRKRLLEVFAVACDLLNGDLRIPAPARAEHPTTTGPHGLGQLLGPDGLAMAQRQRTLERNASSLAALSKLHVPAERTRVSILERLVLGGLTREENASSLGLSESLRQFALPALTEREEETRSLFERLAPEGLTREDAVKLAEYCRLRLRVETLLRVLQADSLSARFALDAFKAERWPRPAEREMEAGREWFVPRLTRFVAFIETSRLWFGDSWGGMLVAALSQPPRSFEDAYVCLLTAYFLSASNAVGRLPLRACLACDRFFVAGKPNRETCSDGCRQCLYRGSQDEAGRTRLREQATKYKRAQRARKVRPVSQASATTDPAKPARASRTSRPPR